MKNNENKMTIGKIILALLGLSIALGAVGIYSGTIITVLIGICMMIPLAKTLSGKRKR